LKNRLVAGLLFLLLASLGRIGAQGVDPKVVSEVTAVRAVLALNAAALRYYTWTEHTEVLVKGDLKSSSDVSCRYDSSGAITKTAIPAGEAKGPANTVSKRYVVRKKADMEDYIARAVGRIQNYAPPDPEQINHLVEQGRASLSPSAGNMSEVRFTNYFEKGDSLTFTYESVSKELLRARVVSTLGSPKDPVTMDVVFETLPDGARHISSATLNAKSKKVQVIRRNVNYEKVAR
jgi:hypothetical protein